MSESTEPTAEQLVNDHIRTVVEGTAPYIVIPYTDPDGRRMKLCVCDDAPGTMCASTARAVAGFLARNAAPDSPHTIPVTAPTPSKPSADERAQIIALYVMDVVRGGTDPAALSVRTVEDATGIPRSAVDRAPTWKAFCEWREKAQVGQIRTVEMTEAMLHCLADPKAKDPADEAEAKELERARLVAQVEREMEAEKNR
jgi:hypothetical protein